jgi:hypothetical protein
VSDGTPSNRRGWYWLMLAPCIAAIWVPSFNSVEPSLAGIPFFYWYQLLLVLITAALTAIVYLKTEQRR